MRKIIAAIRMISIAGAGAAFASDCKIVEGPESIESKVDTYKEMEYLEVLPAEAFKQALMNLKAYCCSRPATLLMCSDEEKNNLTKQYYPESERLFDHLMDIALRRLDGISETAYNLVPDPTGMARRKQITEKAKNATGAQASDIKKIFASYRTLHDTKDNLIKDYNKSIETVSLGDKYSTSCTLMKDIYDKLGYQGKTLVSDSDIARCEKMVQNRIYRESLYVKMLMIEKSNQLLDEGIRAYTKKHFVQEKMMALRNIITRFQDVFKTMVQQAPASKECNR